VGREKGEGCGNEAAKIIKMLYFKCNEAISKELVVADIIYMITDYGDAWYGFPWRASQSTAVQPTCVRKDGSSRTAAVSTIN
jgi:hypothetical protein